MKGRQAVAASSTSLPACGCKRFDRARITARAHFQSRRQGLSPHAAATQGTPGTTGGERVCSSSSAKRFVDVFGRIWVLAFASTGAFVSGDGSALAATAGEPVLHNFDVQLLGVTISHTWLIEALVIGQGIGFVGSLVGGIFAKRRKDEVEQLNARLLQVTKKLRRQARATKKASKPSPSEGRRRSEVVSFLRLGKDALEKRKPEEAKQYFEQALGGMEGAKEELECPWKAERKAYRGLGAAHEQMGKHTEALGYMEHVVHLSEVYSDHSGLGDAYGVIADLYTEMGNYEAAAEWYDRYISEMTIA